MDTDLIYFIVYCLVGITFGLIARNEDGKFALFLDGLFTVVGFTFCWPVMVLLALHYALKGEMTDASFKIGNKVLWTSKR